MLSMRKTPSKFEVLKKSTYSHRLVLGKPQVCCCLSQVRAINLPIASVCADEKLLVEEDICSAECVPSGSDRFFLKSDCLALV
jgi:hypothetical protein